MHGWIESERAISRSGFELNITVLTPIPRSRALESFLKSIYTTEWRITQAGRALNCPAS
jgi:hypothetical protein